MILLDPNKHKRTYSDDTSRDIMLKTIDFFEDKGKIKLKNDDRNRVWYEDFLEFVKENKIFYNLLTPESYGEEGCRFDNWRNCEFNEILAFYGLHYWYTWQVSILGLGPIWMSSNEAQKKRAASLLKEGNVFAFALSERAHGADIYSTEMSLTPQQDGTYLAAGEKYYIGNGNIAEMVSTFGRFAESDEYVFFVANYNRQEYELIKNVVNSQSYVADFVLRDYPVMENEILSKGQEAWDTALNTVNIGKYNLGWASIGISTHAYYEAINHATNRTLYGMKVTDFPHVRQMFVDAYTRLVAMKLFTLRAADYMRVASTNDRRYLLYNPTVKMKVTTQGEEVVNLLWEIIAAKGFEKDTYFEMATRDIRALPKLEGTVHVNIALILKFMANYFFNPMHYAEVKTQDQVRHDGFLFNQGPARGLGDIRFHHYGEIYDQFDLLNINVFVNQVKTFEDLLLGAPPDSTQQKDTDFLLALGEMFTLVVYGQLILENAKIYKIEPVLVDQIFDFMIRDFSRFALTLYSKANTSEAQMKHLQAMIKKPVPDPERFSKVWNEHANALRNIYEMNP